MLNKSRIQLDNNERIVRIIASAEVNMSRRVEALMFTSVEVVFCASVVRSASTPTPLLSSITA
jgi:hypothetical protein